jgi:HK97 gp10 family phage protein
MAAKEVTKIIKEFGKDLNKNLKKLAPYRTGTLKRSIKTFADLQGERVKAGVEMVYYGQYVNEGTYKMSAQPFINDAWDMTVLDNDVDKVMEQQLDILFDKTFKR